MARKPFTLRSALGVVQLGLVLTLVCPQALDAQYRDVFGKNKIQYRDFDWQIYHSTHFDVYYYAEEEVLLEKMVSFAESAYDELSRAFDFQIQNPIPLIYYATHSAFEQNNIIFNFIPEGVGAFASPVRNRMVLPADLPDPELLALIKHELTHIFEYEMLFQGSLARGLAGNPPLWLMEGLASYMAKDEATYDRMYLRDAVVNDSIPPITQTNIGGFFAYRFGHAAFDFIEERWGKDGLLDFLYEFRNTIGSRTDRAVERTFRMEPEDFDREFRRWLRQKYLPQLVETGEPGDFGRPFRIEGVSQSQDSSPVASPSGDLVASFSSYKGDLDIVLYDAQKRRLLRNLTKGYADRYQYFSAQFLTQGRVMGRDLAFSPDGNLIAVFAKRESGRSLVLVNVVKGGIERIIDLDVEQPVAPSFRPDGGAVAFSGSSGGRFDLFEIDLASLEVRALTEDDIYEGSPAYSPDGESLVYSAVIEHHSHLFRLDLADPARRFQLTHGESNDVDAVYSPTGRRVYFTSDRNGIDNIYSLELESGEVRQYTDVVTGCFMPTVLAQPDGTERLVYTGYWKGSFDLFVTDVDEPVGEPEAEEIEKVVQLASLPAFEPDIQVAVDDADKEGYGGYKFFLENADAFFGVTDDQELLGQVILTFSDYLGDRRIVGIFDSQNSLANFDLRYLDLRRRWQWQVRLFDYREFYTVRDPIRGDLDRIDERFQITGLIGSVIYPLSFSTRFEIGGGYYLREFNQPIFVVNPETGLPELEFVSFDDDFPILTAGLVSDKAVFTSFGPISGRRWRFDVSYAPDLDGSGTLFTNYVLDARQYIPVTRRSNFALRFYGAASDGNAPNLLSFGGLDTLRGVDYRSIIGDRVFFANIEFRFPLIDYLAFPVLQFQGIRGRVFFDIGGGWFESAGEDFDFYNSDEDRLEDAIAAYGFGITVRFLGLGLNWDFSKQYDLDTSASGFRTDFYIGTRF